MMMKQNDYGVPLTHDTQRWVSLMTILGALTGWFSLYRWMFVGPGRR